MRMFAPLTEGPAAYAPNSAWPAWAVLPAGAGILALSLVGGGVAAWGLGLAGGMAVGQVIGIILTLLVGGHSPQKRADVLALKAPAGGWGVLPAALLPLFAFTGAWTAAVLATHPSAVYEDLRPFQELLRSDALWVMLLVICLGAPLSEELLFRGFLFSGLAKSRLGLAGTAVLTTVLWTALHAGYSVFGLVEVLGIGLYLSWLLVRTGSLWVTIFCHAVYNSVVAAVLVFVAIPAAA